MPNPHRPKIDQKLRHTQPIVAIVANKWTAPVINLLEHDTLRFSAIQKSLPNTTQKVLTETLRKLERNGIVERTAYPTIPPQVEYKLTSLGRELLELHTTLAAWAEKHRETVKRAQKAYDRRLKS